MAVGLIVAAVYSKGLLLLYILAIVFLIWFGLSIVKARLVANALKVSVKNFPEIKQIVDEVKLVLDYRRNVDVYIVEEGSVNAMLARFFGTRFIILNSELVSDMLEGQNIIQLKWIIGRFIGAMKTKQIRLDILTSFIENLEQLHLLNIFLLPYTRATQYSGDNIGLAVCQDLNQVMMAFDKFLVGNDLARRVNFEGVLEQGKAIEGNFFTVLARIFSPFPHTVSRYLNLLAFAKWRYPEQFYAYIRKQNLEICTDVGVALPHSYLSHEIIAQGHNTPSGSPRIRYSSSAAKAGIRVGKKR
ncbi:MAG: M48 family metallopeptidase [Saprospiraceae bacterium]|nr:M48 family metallopeptidase [Saprospiraceae bacterium]